MTEAPIIETRSIIGLGSISADSVMKELNSHESLDGGISTVRYGTFKEWKVAIHLFPN